MGLNAQNRTLPDWFTRIATHQIVLPRFQRYEAWNHSNVAQLLNTVLQDLPIGALLVLGKGSTEPFLSRAVAGAPTSGEQVNEYLLDGQQRLTALWRGLKNNYDDRTYFLVLEPEAETGLPFYIDSVARWRKKDEIKRRPFWADEPSDQWARHMVPLDLCAPGETGFERTNEWSGKVCKDPAEQLQLINEIWKVRQKFVTFNIPYLALPSQTKPATALDVFIKMNTSAEPLSTYDVVVAQVEAALGKSLHDLVADIKSRTPNLKTYYPPEDLALAANALLQDRPTTNASFLTPQFRNGLISNWARFETGVARAVQFLEEERIFDAARLPTDVVIPVLVALWADAPAALDQQGWARLILRRYIWRAFFSERYERTTATRSLEDYKELRAYIANPNEKLPAILDDAQYALPEANELISAGWPKTKDRIARATLAIALRNGGLDLADGSMASRTNLAGREYHHLFPVAHLKLLGVPDAQAYSALNCALVTWRTNRDISDSEPEKYLAERRSEFDPGEQEIEQRLASHYIPYKEMKAGAYDVFLTARATLVVAAMKAICGIAGNGT